MHIDPRNQIADRRFLTTDHALPSHGCPFVNIMICKANNSNAYAYGIRIAIILYSSVFFKTFSAADLCSACNYSNAFIASPI